MTAVKASDVDARLRRLDPEIVLLLFYGPDAGLIAERAKAAAEGAVENPGDPFQLIRFDGDAIAADPARLADEVGTIGLFGSKRAIWVKPSSRNLAPAISAALDAPSQDTLIVIEAGELQKSSPLRVLCERSPKALALPCYGDEGKSLGAVVDETLRATGLTIAREARSVLIASLGGDRLATRGELAKLALYVHGRREITLEDVDAVLSDVSGLALDAVIDAAFQGDRARIDQGSRRLQAEGTSSSAILGAALRHAIALVSARADIEAGRSADEALRSWRGLTFRRQDAVKAQLALWTAARLRRAIETLQEAVLEARRSEVAAAAAGHALFAIASAARASTERKRRNPAEGGALD